MASPASSLRRQYLGWQNDSSSAEGPEKWGHHRRLQHPRSGSAFGLRKCLGLVALAAISLLIFRIIFQSRNFPAGDKKISPLPIIHANQDFTGDTMHVARQIQVGQVFLGSGVINRGVGETTELWSISNPAGKESQNIAISSNVEAGQNFQPSPTGDDNEAALIRGEPYLHPELLRKDYEEMGRRFKIFVYPHKKGDPYRNIMEPMKDEPSGNYASESYFKKALLQSTFITTNSSEADLFYMPFSISRMRNDKRIGVQGIPEFVMEYVAAISQKWPYWNRTGGADHFYLACHSVSRDAMRKAPHVRANAIQLVCSSSYFLHGFVPHKDASVPQIWPRKDPAKGAKSVKQRKTLAFFAGSGNSPVRAAVVNTWSNDSEIKVHGQRISTPYSTALLTSKFCLHVKGFEVNTARIGDAIYYGCVPLIIANHYDLPFNDILDWQKFSVVVVTADIPLLKDILKNISESEYRRLHRNVVKVQKHFQWHNPPEEYDSFHMVMYELWLRSRVVRYPL